MAYIVSHESASVEFPRWVKTPNGVTAASAVLIKGGADVIDKTTMETPKGIITEVTKEELDFLKSQWLFNEKVKQGSYEIVEGKGKAENAAKKRKGEKDKGAQLTAEDFKDAGLTPPTVGDIETPDDGSVLKKKQEAAENE